MITYKMHRCYSKEEYNFKIKNKVNVLELLIETDYIQEYCIIEFEDCFVATKIQTGGNVYPKVFIKDKEQVYIGIDSHLKLISLKTKKIIWSLKLVTLFYDLIFLKNGSLIVIDEIGVSRYTNNHVEIWYVATDLLIDYFLLNNNLLLVRQDDLKDIKISLEDGAILP